MPGRLGIPVPARPGWMRGWAGEQPQYPAATPPSLVQHASAAVGDQTTSATSVTVTLGGAPQSGSRLLAFCQVDGDKSYATPTGWSLLVSLISGVGATSLFIFHKLAGASEPTSYTFTQTGTNDYMAACVQEWTGVNAASPIQAPSGIVQTAPSAGLTWPCSTVAATVDGSVAIACFATNDTRTATAHGPWTETDNFGGAGVYCGMEVQYTVPPLPVAANPQLTTVTWATETYADPETMMVSIVLAPVVSAHAYTQSLSAALAAAAAFVKMAAVPIPAGALAFVGSHAKSAAKALAAAAVSFSGGIAKGSLRALTAVSSFTGSQAKRVGAPIAAVASFSGSSAKRSARTTIASLPFSGSVVRGLGAVLAGALTSAGSIVLARQKLLLAALTTVGGLARSTAHGLGSSALSFIGNVVRKPGKALAGAVSFAGARAVAWIVGVSAALGLTGTARHASTRALAGSTTPTGAFAKKPSRLAAAALSFSGVVDKARAHLLTAALSFSGVVAKGSGVAFGAVVSLAGAAAKAAGREVIAAVRPGGSVVRAVGALRTAVLQPSSSSARSIVRALGLTSLSFLGSAPKQPSRPFIASTTPTGAVAKKPARSVGATVSFIGAVAKTPGRVLSAVLGFLGVHHVGRVHLVQLLAAVSFAGSHGRVTGKALVALLTPSGGIARSVRRVVRAFITALGSLFQTETVPQPRVAIWLPVIVSRQVAIPTAVDRAVTIPDVIDRAIVLPSFME